MVARYNVKMVIEVHGFVDADGVIEASELAWLLANELDPSMEVLEVHTSPMGAEVTA
jgi:hypothetical protein